MLATWPMVIGALVIGLILGVLVPERSIGSKLTSAAKPSNVGAKVGASVDAATVAPANNQASAPPDSAKPTAAADSAKQSERPCEEQTWPYLSPSCLNGRVPASQPVRVVRTRPADPAVAMKPENEPQSAPGKSAPDQTQAARQNGAANSASEQQAKATPPAAAVSGAAPDERGKPVQPPQEVAKAAPQLEETEESKRPQRAADQTRARQRTTRNQTPRTPIIPEELGDERPRVFVQRDGTRIYLIPERRYVRRLDYELWRQR